MAARRVHADVLILGGGPAGSAAAIACATRGLRVVVAEARGFSAERPGDTLHPGLEPLLAQLGLPELPSGIVGARHRGIQVSWAGPPRFEPYGEDANGPWLGLQVRRSRFDAALLERAAACGANVRLPARATGLAPGPDGGWEVALSGPDAATEAEPVRCRIVMDATGSARSLARRLALPVRRRSVPLLARWGFRRGGCPARDEAPCLAAARDGWTWSARVAPGLYGWVRLTMGSGTADPLHPPELDGLQPAAPARGADVTWRLCERPAGPGWFVLGDAAALLDPSASHGVLKAIMSGMLAGHLAAATLDGCVPARDAAQHYTRWMTDWFESDAARLEAFYGEIGLELRPRGAMAASA